MNAAADPRTRAAAAVSRWYAASLLLALACIAVTWRGFAHHVWTRAFPRFGRIDASLWTRLNPVSLDELLPLLSLLVSGGLAIHTWRRVGAPMRPNVFAAAIGTLVLLGCVALQGLSLAAGVGFTSGVALIGTIPAVLLAIGGWPLVRAYAGPLLLLAFAVPLPMVWVAELTLSLKLWAAGAAVSFVNVWPGLGATLVGSQVVLPPDVFGDAPGIVGVDDACSGLRSLATLTWVACLFACVRPLTPVRRLIVAAAALPLALACNVARIAVLLIVGDAFGLGTIKEGSLAHDSLGVLAFALALAALFTIERAVVAPRPAAPRTTDRETPLFTPPSAAMPVALLAAMAVLSLGTPTPAVGRTTPRIDWSPLSQSITIDGRRYTSSDMPIPDRVRALLATDAVVHRRFVAKDDRSAFDLLIVYHPTARQAVHPPEVCLTATGQTLTFGDTVAIGPTGALFRRLTGRRDNAYVEHLYTYRVGGHYAVDFMRHQALATLIGWMGEDAGVALIRFSAAGDSPRDLAEAAATELLPAVNAVLQ